MRVGGPRRDSDDLSGGYKTDKDFLFPKLPGAFVPSKIRQMPLEWLKERYLLVLDASMGNHSMALFYCCWDEDQFQAVVDDGFRVLISRTMTKLADRAAFIMHRGIGLVEGGDADTPAVTAVMAKVVAELNAGQTVAENAKRSYKLTVDGLKRPAPQTVVAPPPSVPTEDAW